MIIACAVIYGVFKLAQNDSLRSAIMETIEELKSGM